MEGVKRVVVVGIPGVGKTTIVNLAIDMMRKQGVEAEQVVFGTVMLKEAKERYGVKDRDEIRRLPVNIQKELQQSAATKISQMKKQVLIVDTHLFIRTYEGFYPGLPFEVVRRILPTNLILVEAPVEAIIERRKNDPTRKRDELPNEEIRLELNLGRTFLATCAVVTGAPITIIVNEQGKAEEAARKLVKALGFEVN